MQSVSLVRSANRSGAFGAISVDAVSELVGYFWGSESFAERRSVQSVHLSAAFAATHSFINYC